MMKTGFSTILFILVATYCAPGQSSLPDCEWCGASEAPSDLSWDLSIAGKEEGIPIIITGTVLYADGDTPAPDILIYAYHANKKGVYPKRGNETGNGQRHGYLRGWLKTSSTGTYRITTIKPGSYGSEPAHIHMTIKEPNKKEYWIESVTFKGDPNLRKLNSGVVTLRSNDNGILTGTRNIIL